MKIRFYLAICLSIFFSTVAFSMTTKSLQSIIEVTGKARIYIPIDQVNLRIISLVSEKTVTAVELKTYQLGIQLKNIFKEFKIMEKAIKKSDIRIYDDQYYDDNGKKQLGYYGSIEYIIEFKQLDLVDDLRERCIKAGATSFYIDEFINSKAEKNIAKAKQMAYQNARKSAEETLQGSGLKIGLPVSISGRGVYYSGEEYSDSAGLGPSRPVREPLWQQQQIFIDEKVEVKFLVE